MPPKIIQLDHRDGCLKKFGFAISALLLPMSLYASDYGTTGLIDVPSARMQADGLFTSTAAIQSSINAYAITYQALPWFEATFRYSGSANLAGTASTGFRYYDRNYEAKFLLLEESEYLPQLAVGIRDLVGTGKFGAEYLVASKQLGQWDATLGLGWGRLAGSGHLKNPLRAISTDFDSRDFDTGLGGELSYDQFFSGKKIGVFGGVEYHLNDYPVSILAEYNPDEYVWETTGGGFTPKSPLSFGVKWQALPNISLSFTRQHGQEWGITLQAMLETKAAAPKYEPAPFVSSHDIAKEDLPAGINPEKWYDMLLYDVERSGLLLRSAKTDDAAQKVTLEISNVEYASWSDAVAKMQQLASLHIPTDIKTFDIVAQENGHNVHTIRVPRLALNRAERSDSLRGATILPGRVMEDTSYRTNFVKSKYPLNVELDSRFMFFDPDNPLGYQFYVKVGSSVDLPWGTKLKGAYAFDLVNNFDKFNRNSTSVLPHVRSDAVKYLKEGKNGLERLYLDKRGSFAGDLHYRAYAGILESMYSGVGGEILYQPYQSRLAFAVSGNWVKQRDYDRKLDHLDYSTYTAFASAYWATPFNNYDVALHVGKYLAKDYGATLEVRRTFNNGWQVGLWATKTNVSAEDFGEGSFDKGMFFRIPLGILGSSGRSSYNARIRPIQRDGGARIEGFTGDLWWDIREARYDVFNEAIAQ